MTKEIEKIIARFKKEVGKSKGMTAREMKLIEICINELVVKNCNLQNVSGSALDFYTDLMKLINTYCNKGLKKPDLVNKMEYATESCKLS